MRVGAVEGGGEVEGRVGEVAARVLRRELAGRGRDADDGERLADGRRVLGVDDHVAGRRRRELRELGRVLVADVEVALVGEHEVHHGFVGPVRVRHAAVEDLQPVETLGPEGAFVGGRERVGRVVVDREVLEGRELGDLGEAGGRGEVDDRDLGVGRVVDEDVGAVAVGDEAVVGGVGAARAGSGRDRRAGDDARR